jgi:hypothetical protein
MAFPLAPTDGQSITINGIGYIYSSSTSTWTRVTVDVTLSSGSYANAAFSKANSAASYGNSAFIVANNAFTYVFSADEKASYAFATANSAGVYANSAYAAANNSTDLWVRAQANSAFISANSAGVYSNAAFLQANTPSYVANSAALYANAAFAAANNSTDLWVRGQANNAYNTANSSGSYANAAFAKANSISSVTAVSIAVDTFTGTGACTTFTLSTTPIGINYTTATVANVVQQKSAYNISGSNIIFSEAPTSNSPIEVTVLNSDNTLTLNSANSSGSYANSAFARANNSLSSDAGGTVVGNITVTGNISLNYLTATSLGVAGATPNTSGGGITFPATQVPSANTNTLDDYKEGTFTPTIIGTTTSGTGTYTRQVGTYTKIGNLVNYNISLVWTNHTGTGNISIGELPITTSATNWSPCSLKYDNLTLTSSNILTAWTANNSTTVDLFNYPVGGGSSSSVPMDTNAEINVSGFYFV